MDTTDEKLNKVNIEIADLEEKLANHRKLLSQLGVLGRPLDFETQEKFRPSFMLLEELERSLNDARQRQLALQLTLLNESTTKLNESAKKQLMASRRLETFSLTLLMVTILLALVATAGYLLQLNIEKGFSSTTALSLTLVGALIMVGIVLVGVVLVLRRAEKGVS